MGRTLLRITHQGEAFFVVIPPEHDDDKRPGEAIHQPLSYPAGPVRSSAEQQPLGDRQLGGSLLEINYTTLGSVEEWS